MFVSPSERFEQRVRTVVRQLMRLHPGMGREQAMTRARQVAPRKLPLMIRLLGRQVRGLPHPPVYTLPVLDRVIPVFPRAHGPFTTHHGRFTTETGRDAAHKRWRPCAE